MSIDYLEYLKSPQWAETRQLAIEGVGRRCQVCNSGGQLQVHHRTYERLGHEDPLDLTVLCVICHNLFHVHGKWAQKAPTDGPKHISEIMAAMR